MILISKDQKSWEIIIIEIIKSYFIRTKKYYNYNLFKMLFD